MTDSEQKIVTDVLPGSSNDDAVVRGLMAEGIKRSELSRIQIAEKMSYLLAQPVTERALDNFTATSHSHRFPLAWLRAFCVVTGDWRLLQHVAEQAGFILLPQSEKDLLSIGELVVTQRRSAQEIDRHAENIIQRRSGRP